jgi:branched-chain amino acid aminotransferase
LGPAILLFIARDCPVEVVIVAWPWCTYLGESAVADGIRATISHWAKFRSGAIPASAKACGQYVNSVLAVQDAVTRGFDEAILLDDEGKVSEGSGENFFLVKDSCLYTDDDRSPVLIGITRDLRPSLGAGSRCFCFSAAAYATRPP